MASTFMFTDSTQFRPTSINNCILWLDSADSNAISVSTSGVLLSWTDKSGLGNSISTISANPPTYSSALGVTFNAASTNTLIGPLNTTYSNDATLFIVGSYTSNSGSVNPRLFVLASNAATDNTLTGQLNLIVQSSSPIFTTYVGTGSNPTGYGLNAQTALLGAYSSPFLYTNSSTYNTNTLTNQTFLYGNSQPYSSTIVTSLSPNSYYLQSYNKYSIGGYPNVSQSATDCFNGSIFEVIAYSRALTSNERQTVEGYLGWKWNLQDYLPFTNPYRLSFPSVFESRNLTVSSSTPRDISGCVVWLDGADASTKTQGGPVTTWSNIMSIANNATASGTNSPLYTRNGVYFNAGNVMSLPDGSFGSGNEAYTYFIVFTPLTTNVRNPLFTGGTYNSLPNALYVSVNTNNTIIHRWGPSSTPISTTNSITNGNRFLYETWYNQTTRNVLLNFSGSANDTPGTARAQNAGSCFLGINLDTVNRFNGVFHEFIRYNTSLSLSDRQQVEGYLAWKWGLQANLPGNHPYKTAAPSGFLPNSLPNCLSWFDSLQSNTVSFTNTQLVWLDKSSNSNSFVSWVASNNPQYLSNAVYFNNPPGYGANTAQGFRVLNNLQATSIYKTIFVVVNPDPIQNVANYNSVLRLSGVGSAGAGYFTSIEINARGGGLDCSIEYVNNGTRAFTFETVYDPNVLNVFTFLFNSNGGFIYKNGSIFQAIPSAYNFADTITFNNISVGGGYDFRAYSGSIYEILYYQTGLSDAQRRQIEGYLAWKWGTQKLLPSDSIYREVYRNADPPFPLAPVARNSNTAYFFYPTTLPSCCLWLDAADSSTIDISASQVIQWRDKSGYDNNATTGMGTFTWSNATLEIPQDSYLVINGPNYTSPYKSVFVVASIGSVAATEANYSILRSPSSNWAVNLTMTKAVGNDPSLNRILLADASREIVQTSNARASFNSGVFMTSILYSSAGRYIFGNGSPLVPFVPGTASFGEGNSYSYLGGFPTETTSSFSLYELIVFDGDITHFQRQQIEGYLAWKWGLNNQLPKSHPYFFTPTPFPLLNPRLFGTSYWKPTNINKLMPLWIDSADPNAITVTNGIITAIQDKSPLKTQVTVNYTSTGPRLTKVNQLSAMLFQGAQSLRGTFTTPLQGINLIVFAVASLSSQSSTNTRLVSFSQNTKYDYLNPSGFIPLLRFEGGALFAAYRNQAFQTSASLPFNTNSVLTSETNNYVIQLFRNGSQQTSVNSTTTLPFNIDNYGIGYLADYGFSTDTSYWIGNICEVIVYFDSLNIYERQTVEAYLAWKWGLQDSLPNDNIFKNTPPSASYVPTTAFYSPLNIPGCVLWLDAADSSTITLSGNNVTQLRDKSISNFIFNGSPGTYPTYTNNLNGKPVITTATGQKLTTTTWNQNFSRATMFVVLRPRQNITVDYQSYPIFRRVTGTGTIQLDITYASQFNYYYYLQVWTNNSFMIQASLNNTSSFNPTNLPLLLTAVVNGGTNIARYNGTTLSTILNSPNTFVNLSGVTLDILGSADARGFDTAEVLLYGYAFNAEQYTRVEGYLAWKWGIQGNLPLTHPYRNAPPTPPYIPPQPPTTLIPKWVAYYATPTIYVGTSDNGINWSWYSPFSFTGSTPGITPDTTWSKFWLGVNPTRTRLMVGAGNLGGIQSTSDLTTWTRAQNVYNDGSIAFAVNGDAGSRIWIANGQGTALYCSTDDGVTFYNLNAPGMFGNGFAVEYNKATGVMCACGGQGGNGYIVRSATPTVAGSWTKVMSDTGQDYIRTLACGINGRWICGIDSGLYYSNDDGLTWTGPTNSNVLGVVLRVNHIIYARYNNTFYFVLRGASGLYSTQDGITVTRVNTLVTDQDSTSNCSLATDGNIMVVQQRAGARAMCYTAFPPNSSSTWTTIQLPQSTTFFSSGVIYRD